MRAHRNRDMIESGSTGSVATRAVGDTEHLKREEPAMDPRFASWLTESQDRRNRDDLEREYVVYRPPSDHLRPRLARATRRQLAALFLALGQRLSDEPGAAATSPDIEPAARTT
jgi:hypothetical protein